MNAQTSTHPNVASAGLPESAPAAARAVFRLLKNLRHGTLVVHMPDGAAAHFGSSQGNAGPLPSFLDPLGGPDAKPQVRGYSPEGEPRAGIRLRNWNVCAAALKSGDIGVAETFIAGDWTTPDLTALLKLFVANREDLEAMVYGSWWGSWLYRCKHLFNGNSRSGSKRNIHAHYDLGNSFYRLWLDPTMNYSSAWFEGDRTQSLSNAQCAKVRRALRETGVQPGDRVLEIGCGWGALAECAARDFGASVTGVTLSSEQLIWAQQRLAAGGLPGSMRFQDYRDVDDGPYDAIASIEMFEAVGREYWPGFFGAVRELLKPGGKACIQSITIRDDLFDRYIKSSDFIQQYIFPGGLLPSAREFRRAAEDAGLKVVNELDFGQDYAETLKRWRDAFLHQDAAVRGLGFDTRFMRTWEFYLAYCEAAFAMGNTSVVQFTLQRR